MFFAFAIPTILEAIISVATATVVSRVASDLYDKVTAKDDE